MLANIRIRKGLGVMNETTDNAAAAEGAADGTRPQFAVHAQYTKDLSFENPRAPNILFQNKEQPQGEIRVEIGNRSFGNDRYEVSLQINVEAKTDGNVSFIVELVYGGIFTIGGLTEEQLEMVMAVECPRILFPFARRVIADTVRDGGLPTLMIGPIDFLALYRHRHGASGARGNGKDQPVAEVGDTEETTSQAMNQADRIADLEDGDGSDALAENGKGNEEKEVKDKEEVKKKEKGKAAAPKATKKRGSKSASGDG